MVQKNTRLRSSSKERHQLTWKGVLVAVLILFSIWQLIPTINYYTKSSDQLQSMDPSALQELKNKVLKLGLDLQGGIHLVMEVDTKGMSSDEARDAVDKAMTVIANRVDQFGLTEPVVQRQGDNRIIIELPGEQDVERAKNLIGQTARLEFKMLKSNEDIQFIFDKIDLYLSGQEETSTAEADSTADNLFEENTTDESSLKKFSSLMRFQDIGSGIPSFNMLVSEDDVPRVNAYLDDPEVQRILENARAMILWGPEGDRDDNYRQIFIANSANEMTGEKISDARVSMGSGMEAVSYTHLTLPTN